MNITSRLERHIQRHTKDDAAVNEIICLNTQDTTYLGGVSGAGEGGGGDDNDGNREFHG